MGIFNYLEYDGANSLDNGVYISGEGAYNAPERAVEKISIPGRNGDLIIDRGRFENIEVSYPAGVFGSDQSEFAAKVRAYRNKLASSRSYKRLTDSYHPDEFRLALFKDGLEVEPTNYNRAGEFEITFDCKPQRFLVSGETPVSYPRSWGQTETATGNPAEFEADESTGIKSLQVALEPIQSGNGTPSPDNVRAISGHSTVETHRTGRNLLEIPDSSRTAVGVTVTVADGVITLSGTATSDSFVTLATGLSFGGTYTLKEFTANGVSSSNSTRSQLYSSTTATGLSVAWNSASGTHSGNLADASDYFYRIRLINGTDYNGVKLTPMLVLGTEAPTAFELYQGETFTTDLGRTVYGGTLDLVSGVLTVDRAMVDLGSLTWTRNASEYSYAYFYSNGFLQYAQIPLVCSHYPFASGGKAGLTTDKTMAYYSASSTRMTIRDDSYTDATAFKTAMSGVQCVYPLLNPQTYQLTPQEVEALVGSNVVWSDGEVTIQYGEDPEKIVNPTLFPSNPLIALTGSGTVTIGDTTITSTAPTGTTVYIDCESKEIYYYLNGALTNGSTFISFSGNDFPVIEAGAPKVTRTGTIGIVITPRWWLV